MSDLKPELIPNAPLPIPEAPPIPDYEQVKGTVESRLHSALAMQGMVATGTLPLIEITGKGAHKPHDHLDKTLAHGDQLHADFDDHGRLRSVDITHGELNIEHADFDSRGRITEDSVSGIMFQYDANHRVREAVVTKPGESTAYSIDEKGDIIYAKSSSQNEVDEFVNMPGKHVLTTTDAANNQATFNYDKHFQFKDGEVLSHMRFKKFKANRDGVPVVTAEGFLI